jgi:predicted nucleic acid-binding protein
MKKVVVDTSVIVKFLNTKAEKYISEANEILLDTRKGKISLVAPELSRYEIGNALLNKKLDMPFAQDALELAYNLPIQFIKETYRLAYQTYKISITANITYYDASFIALAKQENAVLVTDNLKHQGKLSDITVIPLSKYK